MPAPTTVTSAPAAPAAPAASAAGLGLLAATGGESDQAHENQSRDRSHVLTWGLAVRHSLNG